MVLIYLAANFSHCCSLYICKIFPFHIFLKQDYASYTRNVWVQYVERSKSHSISNFRVQGIEVTKTKISIKKICKKTKKKNYLGLFFGILIFFKLILFYYFFQFDYPFFLFTETRGYTTSIPSNCPQALTKIRSYFQNFRIWLLSMKEEKLVLSLKPLVM